MVYVHLGSWKTGTTLIQSILRKNESWLARESLQFADQKVAAHREIFAPAFRRAIRSIVAGKTDSKLCEEAASAFLDLGSDQAKHVIHSWEPFLGHPLRSSRDHFYQAEACAEWFLRYVSPKGCDLSFIFYCRRQTDFLEAMYAQEIRKGRFLGDMGDYFETLVPHDLSWTTVVDPFVERFDLDRIKIIPFESIREGVEPFIARFFAPVSVSIPPKLVAHANPSFSGTAIEIARRTYPLLDSKEFPLMERFLVQNFSNRTHPRANLLDDERKKAIRVAVSESNKRLFQMIPPEFNGESLGYY